MQIPKCFDYPFDFFVDVGEDSIMMDDVATPLNLLVVPVKEKNLKTHHLMWMSPNNYTKKNCLEEWCALKLII